MSRTSIRSLLPGQVFGQEPGRENRYDDADIWICIARDDQNMWYMYLRFVTPQSRFNHNNKLYCYDLHEDHAADDDYWIYF